MKNFLILVCVLFSARSYAVQKPVLTWAFATSTKAVPSTTSTNIINDKHALYKLFVKNLNNYDHVVLEATLPRIEEEIKSKKLICYPGSSEFSRRRNFTYLTSLYIQPAPQLVVSKDLGKQLLKKFHGSVSLKKLLLEPNLRGALAEGRSYGETLDHILKGEKVNLKRQVYNTFIQTVVNQIKIGRMDYTLEYPFIVKALEEKSSAKNDVKLMTIPLSDAEEYVTQYAACSKTPEGLKVIKHIDEVVKKNVADKSYWTGVLNSLPASERADFQKNIDKFVRLRQIKSDIIE